MTAEEEEPRLTYAEWKLLDAKYWGRVKREDARLQRLAIATRLVEIEAEREYRQKEQGYLRTIRQHEETVSRVLQELALLKERIEEAGHLPRVIRNGLKYLLVEVHVGEEGE